MTQTSTSRKTDDIPLAIWPCAQQTSQWQRHDRYLPESNRHPAKMLPEIARRAIETYSQPGDLIVDPMCGIGTTLVEAVHLGRRAIGVELEDRWAGLARANLTHAQTQGAARCGQVICGDARDLTRLLAHRTADLLLVSPPYANATLGDPRAGHGVERARSCEGRRTTDTDRAHAQQLERSCRYGKRPDNVAALPYRRADLVLVSPPYACEVADVEPTARRSGGLPVKETANYSDSPDNLGHARSHTYLTAMAEIYAACERVLKPGGFLVVVTNDTRERGKLRNLVGNTVTLCENAGLDYWQHVIALLAAVRDDELIPRVSFWQTLYLRNALARAERVQPVCHEDVLVVRKPPPAKAPNTAARRAA